MMAQYKAWNIQKKQENQIACFFLLLVVLNFGFFTWGMETKAVSGSFFSETYARPENISMPMITTNIKRPSSL